MKRINNLILALAGLFAAACADTFEERYDLAVNTDRYSVTAEAGKLPVTVYCSGAWTAQLTAESAWATLDRTAGSGITTIRLNYADNPGLTRSVGVVLRGSGLEKTVTVVQKAGITAHRAPAARLTPIFCSLLTQKPARQKLSQSRVIPVSYTHLTLPTIA